MEWEREALPPLKLFVWSHCLKAFKRTLTRPHIQPLALTTGAQTKTHNVEQTQIRRTEMTLWMSCSLAPAG